MVKKQNYLKTFIVKGVIMKYLKSLFSFVIIFLVFSCKDSSNPGLPLIENYKYPLNVGNKWNYSEHYTFTNPRPDSVQNYIDDFSSNGEVIVDKDTIINSISVFKLKDKIVDQYGVFEVYGFYANTIDGLLKYAYSGSSYGLPKVNQKIQFLFKGKRFSSVSEIIKTVELGCSLNKIVYDSLYFFEPPRVVYKYPITQNLEWGIGTNGLKLNKQYEGKTTLQTSIGILECVVIKWKYDLDNNGNWDEDFFVYEYLSAKGKVKMIYTIKDIKITTAEYPDGIGIVDLNYEQMITSINF